MHTEYDFGFVIHLYKCLFLAEFVILVGIPHFATRKIADKLSYILICSMCEFLFFITYTYKHTNVIYLIEAERCIYINRRLHKYVCIYA